MFYYVIQWFEELRTNRRLPDDQTTSPTPPVEVLGLASPSAVGCEHDSLSSDSVALALCADDRILGSRTSPTAFLDTRPSSSCAKKRNPSLQDTSRAWNLPWMRFLSGKEGRFMTADQAVAEPVDRSASVRGEAAHAAKWRPDREVDEVVEQLGRAAERGGEAVGSGLRLAERRPGTCGGGGSREDCAIFGHCGSSRAVASPGWSRDCLRHRDSYRSRAGQLGAGTRSRRRSGLGSSGSGVVVARHPPWPSRVGDGGGGRA